MNYVRDAAILREIGAAAITILIFGVVAYLRMSRSGVVLRPGSGGHKDHATTS